MEPVSHVLRGLPVWWRDVIAEKYNWVLEDGYMERSNRRRDLHISRSTARMATIV